MSDMMDPGPIKDPANTKQGAFTSKEMICRFCSLPIPQGQQRSIAIGGYGHEYEGQCISALVQQRERLGAALGRYGRHTHPNCHDLTLQADGSFGPRNGCLCGLDAALSGDGSAGETKAPQEDKADLLSMAALIARLGREDTYHVSAELLKRASAVLVALADSRPPAQETEREPEPEDPQSYIGSTVGGQ